jgi:hypothetical protein
MRPASWALGVAVIGSALAVGSVHESTLCVVTGVLALATILTWWKAEPMKARSPATLLLCTAIALTLYTAIQLAPLPVGLLAAIAPHNADVWSRSLVPLGLPGPRWAPLSVDPHATTVEVLKGVAYLLAFVTSVRIARQRDGLRFIAATVIFTGIVLAVSALVHPALGAHKLFGLYEPTSAAERHIAPLLNANNLAAYLNLAFCLALASALAPDTPFPRVISGTIAVFLAATQVWVSSRAGVVAMCLGTAVILAILGLGRTRRFGAIALSFATAAMVAVGGALVVLGGSDEASTELLDSDTSKVALIRQVFRMLPAVPFFGCGRGAFGSAFAAFRSAPGYNRMAYPENVLAQWVLEWGLPVGIAGVVAILVALRPHAVLPRSTAASGAWAGLVAVAVGNMADLGSEVPGLVLGGVMCAAIVVAGTPGHRPRWRVEGWCKYPSTVATVGVVAAAVAIVAVAPSVDRSVDKDELALFAEIGAHAKAEEVRGKAHDAMLRHPAEPYLPFIVAQRASIARDDNPMPWIGATLERASMYGPAHLVLANMVAKRSPSQGRLELRLAMEQEPEDPWVAMREAPSLVAGYYDATEVVPSGPLGVVMLDYLVQAVSERLPSTRVRLDEELSARSPLKPGPTLRAARDAVEDLEAKPEPPPWCEGPRREECRRRAIDLSTRGQRLAPDKCEGYALMARARVAGGDGAKALAEFEHRVESVADRSECLKELAMAAFSAGDEQRAESTLDRVAKAGCGKETECVQNLVWVGDQETAHGNARKALSLYRRAYEQSGEDEALLERLARLAAEAGLHAEAAKDYELLSRKRPEEARWKDAAIDQRLAAARAAAGISP